TIVNFLVKPGDAITADQDIIEVETNKANMNIASPSTGTIKALTAKLQESYPVGAVLGQIEVTEEEAARLGLDTAELAASAAATAAASAPPNGDQRRVPPPVRGLPVPAHAAGASYMSPRMKARMSELGLHAADLAGIAGSGAAGRV